MQFGQQLMENRDSPGGFERGSMNRDPQALP